MEDALNQEDGDSEDLKGVSARNREHSENKKPARYIGDGEAQETETEQADGVSPVNGCDPLGLGKVKNTSKTTECQRVAVVKKRRPSKEMGDLGGGSWV
jgi:hypothetical protein